MRYSLERGAVDEGIVVLITLAIIIFLFIIPAHAPGPVKSLPSLSNPSLSNPNTTTSSNPLYASGGSAYTSNIHLSTGDASSAIEPYEEYVTMSNYGNTPLDITGWSLTNARGTRTYSVGSSVETFPSARIYIPKATPFVPPSGSGSPSDIVLKSNETAIITTGSIGNTLPYKITSFKENECSGYLSDLPGYTFTPSLDTECVPPSQEPGAASLDLSCQNFLENMQSCHTPKLNAVDSQGDMVDNSGNTCNNCVDGTSNLSQSCVAFIVSHYNYAGCVSYHENDPNFYGTTWRIFLNQPFELWAANHETISLFDSLGKLVASQSY